MDQQNEDSWFKVKKYLHFDFPLSEKDFEKVKAYISDPHAISKHPFYPFISYNVPKYKMVEVDGVRKLNKDDFRQLSYASHLDSQILSFYSHKISKKYELELERNNISKNVIAFRSLKEGNEAKCNIHLARDAFDEIKKIKNCTAYAMDIKGFFDSLDPAQVKKMWLKVMGYTALPQDEFAIYCAITNASVVALEDIKNICDLSKTERRICDPKTFRNKIRTNEKKEKLSETVTRKGLIQIKSKGIPQGSAISATLANIYMLDFDVSLMEKVRSLGGEYYRYCDDIFCVLPAKTEFDLISFIKTALAQIGLNLNDRKTEVCSFEEVDSKLKCVDRPMQYLGFMFNGEDIYVRTGSISRYRRLAKQAIVVAKKSMAKENQKRKKNGLVERPLYKKKLYKRFHYSGKTNFLSYLARAKKILQSDTIKRQAKKLAIFLKDEIEKDYEG